jgi:nitrate/nitrite transporter NarK
MSAERKTFFGWWIVLLSFLSIFITYGTKGCFGVLKVPMMKEFGWSSTQVSLGITVNFWVYSIFVLFIGRMIESKMKIKWLFMIGAFLGALGYMSVTLIGAPFHFALTYGLIVGLANTFTGMVPSTTIIARWFKKRLSTAMGIAVAASPLGAAVLPLIIDRIDTTLGWRWSFIILGMLILVLMPVAYFLAVDYPEDRDLHVDGLAEEAKTDKTAKKATRTVKEILTTWQIWAISIAYLIFAMSGWAVLAEIPTFSVYEKGLNTTTAALVLTAVNGLGVLVSLIWGPLGDRTGKRKTVLSVELAMLAVAILLLSRTNSAVSLMGFGAFFGLTYMGGYSLFPSIAAETYGREGFGMVNGILAFFGGVGGGLGSLVAASLFDLTGTYNTAWMVFPALLILSIVLVLVLKPVGETKA